MANSDSKCNPFWSKAALIVFNSFALILGCVALVMGVTSNKTSSEIELVLNTSKFSGTSNMLIIGGGITTATTIMSILGVALEKRFLLICYFSIMTGFAMVFSVGAVVILFFLDSIEVNLSESMEITMRSKYDEDTGINLENKKLTEAWDHIQEKYECCGVHGGLTGTGSWFNWQTSVWFQQGVERAKSPDQIKYVPKSCCNKIYPVTQCQPLNKISTKPPQKDLSLVNTENPALYSKGCLIALKIRVMKLAGGLFTVIVLLFFVVLICAMLALQVATDTRRDSD